MEHWIDFDAVRRGTGDVALPLGSRFQMLVGETRTRVSRAVSRSIPRAPARIPARLFSLDGSERAISRSHYSNAELL